jgi:hypothetical protein
MSVDKAQWPEEFATEQFPTFPCPHCGSGRVALVDGSVRVSETGYSVAAHSEDPWEPDWIIERFSAHLKCAEKNCGEYVVALGDTTHVEDWDEQGPNWEKFLRPRYFFPAIPIFRIPPSTPDKVSSSIEEAFALFWSDLPSAMGKIRISLENLLDDRRIPVKGKDRKGKLQIISLHQRIEKYQAKNSHVGESLMAIKMVGNLGSHREAEIPRETVFGVFGLLEDALQEVYENRTATLKRTRTALIKSRGRRTGKPKAKKKKR